MARTISDDFSVNFYTWEARGRGYFHFNEPIEIEPPFVTFYHRLLNQREFVDDGKFNILDSVISLFTEKDKIEVEDETDEILPIPIHDKPILKAFKLSFPKGTEISPHSFLELLKALSFSYHTLSFEIIANSQSISIQFVASELDSSRVGGQLKAYFPFMVIEEGVIDDFGFTEQGNLAICDFGYDKEFMCPLKSPDSFQIDTLTSLFGHMENLGGGNVIVFQVLLKGCIAPWKSSIKRSVSDGRGASFFNDMKEMPSLAEQKTSSPLFASIVRLAVQGNNEYQARLIARGCIESISSMSQSSYNRLIPLSNEGYEYQDHVENLFQRTTNRLGMIMSSHELVNFVHYPSRSIVSEKLGLGQAKTKALPKEAIGQDCILGHNLHQGREKEVSLGIEARLRHTHIIGATGVGKSTLIANMILEDIKHGRGCVLFDPHGDIAEDILMRIPESRKEYVIVVDPSDTDFPIGFNLFDAHSEAEKIVLSSDLVSAFKRHATAWGDNMTAVLSNAINAFLESSKGGTLIELKRFLLEEKFRKAFLESVDDPSIHYYWELEYPMVRKGIAPLLTRIDTFLRPKVIRYMLAQQRGLDFRACIEEKKIVLLKLSQGLIGEDNSYLLGSLFLSKFNQVAQGRQMLSKDKRHPYYVYLDEFQNFITPSISQILSGSRKYGLGLVLAHQELAQIDESKILNSVISNPHVRICFRLGDNDAKRLSDGFSYFEADDLQNLGIGEAIIRIGSKKNDCNIKTFPMPEITERASSIKEHIISNTRKRYASLKSEIEERLNALLPKKIHRKEDASEINVVVPKKDILEINKEVSKPIPKESFEKQKIQYKEAQQKEQKLRKHEALKNYVRTVAIGLGFNAVFEKETKNGGKVDVSLQHQDIHIAVEISVTNSNDYEAKNIFKCFEEEYALVYLISESPLHLKNIRKKAEEKLSKREMKLLFCISPEELREHLSAIVLPPEPKHSKRVSGWRVEVNYHPDDTTSSHLKNLKRKLHNLIKKK